ncbi:MAG: metallophosphoesterase [Ruminococcaceae bacterium]|nr:metallophosphoesterase [Oscillospiraceae bacterium]
MKKRIIALIVGAVVFLVLFIWIIWANKALELNTYTVESKDLPKSFNGFRIAHVSDLHNNKMGKNNKKLLDMLRSSKPDIIAITGDLIDSRNTNVNIALQFVEEAVKIAPCYYVNGNHEARVSEYAELKKGLNELGVVVLENEKIEFERSGEKINIIGVIDPSFKTDYLFGDSTSVMQRNLQILIDVDRYTILLSHRPELMKIYANNSVNLVLSGHAHGGQFRFPLVGGLFAPSQGLFPEYDSGLYIEGKTNMIVSRGIGSSIIPLRFNNRPEVILITLLDK